MKFKSLLIALSATVLACSAPSEEKYGQVSQEFHAWDEYHWFRTANPFTVTLSRNLTSNWVSYLNTASYDWSQSSVLETTVVQGSVNPKRCNPSLGRVEVCNSTYGKNGWLGIAQIWINGKHITQGSVKLNDSYFNMAKYNTVAYRNLVMCQEVGHTFGLGHQDENQTNPNLGSCMDYSANPAGPLSNEHPNAHDYEELEEIYSHLDTTSSASSQDSNSNPDDLGKLISSNLHSEEYVRYFGQGQLVITHVFLAE
jgi:hypothetical protein